MRFGTFRGTAGVLALSCLAAAAAAQTQPAPSQAAPSGPRLDIPQDVTFVGPARDTNVARATAIVNDEIITRSDIEQRISLAMAAQRAQVPPGEMDRLRAQVLRALIDETLQIQRAREMKIEVDQKEVDRFYTRYAESLGHTPKTFGDYLKSIGSSERSAKRQILGEVAWRELQRRLPRTSPSDDEVEQILQRLTASRGASEFRVAEIFIRSTPETNEQVRGRMAQIIEQVRGGAPFQAVARQYSEATTKATGGDLGWVRAEQLPPELAAVVQAMPVGAISDPIQVQGGFSVVALVDSRQFLVSNPRDAQLSLMQMAIDMPPGTTEATARQQAERLAQATQNMGGCGRAEETARTIGAELISNDEVRVRELPAQMQQTVLNMQVGQATAPFGSVQRVSVLILCGRDDPPAPTIPTQEAIAEQIEDQRMNRQALRYLRDLRRDAVIEYR